MQISEGVNAIIEKRMQKIPAIQEKQKRLIEISNELQEISKIRTKMLQNAVKLNINDDVKDKIESLSIGNYMKVFDVLKKQYEEIIERFSRKEINIAVIGAARQGKSMLLQSISNLDNEVIPAFMNNDCTGATSVIKNVPGATVTAEITFRTENEMIGSVQAYLDEIFGKNVITLGSFNQIGTLNLDELSKKIQIGSPKTTKFEHLSKYVRYFSTWSPLVERGTLTVTNESDIQQYVAQHNGKNEADPDRKDYYYYLAVKDVVISCEFKNAETGNIVLRDTIGLGDTSLGIEEKMLDAIGLHSDAAIIVRRPEVSTGKLDSSDVMIYQKLHERFGKRNMEKWLFWLINKTDQKSPYGNNSDRCKAFNEKISQLEWNLAGHYVVDVADTNQVNNEFLETVLQTLIYNMDSIDNGILIEVTEQTKQVYEEYKKIQEAVEEILLSEMDKEVDKVEFLDNRWKSFYERTLMKSIVAFQNQLAEKKDMECEAFRQCVEEILGKSSLLLPSEEELIEELESGGHNRPFEVYAHYLDKMRTNFTEQFLKIDELIFDKQVKEFKEHIVDILAGDDGGRLKYVQPINENKDKSEWLHDIAINVFDKKRYSQFKTAFIMLKDFQLTVRGFLMHRIRSRIDRLNGSGYETYETLPTEIAKEIKRTLNRKLKDICEELDVTLKEDFYKDPNRILYAVIAEFYDRINFSYTENDSQDVESAWKSLYRDNCHKVWMNEFRESQAMSELYNEWYCFSKRLKAYTLNDFILSL